MENSTRLRGGRGGRGAMNLWVTNQAVVLCLQAENVVSCIKTKASTGQPFVIELQPVHALTALQSPVLHKPRVEQLRQFSLSLSPVPPSAPPTTSVPDSVRAHNSPHPSRSFAPLESTKVRFGLSLPPLHAL